MLFFALIAGAYQARSTDIYGPAANELQIPLLRVGGATYSDVVLLIASIVTPPSGISPNGTEDVYNPANNQLTAPAVQVGGAIYYNAVGTVGKLISIGSVSGADTFDGTRLRIPYILVGSIPYYNVELEVSVTKVVGVHGGMPNALWDQYDVMTGQLTIPAVQFGSTVYTNVVLNLGIPNGITYGITESVLYAFHPTTNIVENPQGDGAYPSGSLIQASDGNLYGMTSKGGANAAGAVIKVAPNGTVSLLYSFQALSDGANPNGSLVQAKDGNFYGMTANGGTNYTGTVFKLTPTGTESLLHSFGPLQSPDGANPQGSLVQASDGNLYGMSDEGGMNDTGAIIKVAIPAGTVSVFYSFGATESGDAEFPTGNLIQANDGNLYGMTPDGGANGNGAVIKITMPAGIESVIYSFGGTGPSDGKSPYGSLIQANDGNLYGMTTEGGATGDGAIVEITLSGDESVLYSLGAAAGGDGKYPGGSLIQASDGNFYGLTNQGGAYGDGALIMVTPGGNESVLHSFGNAEDGSNPNDSLIQASDGNLYGLTFSGGAYGYGTVIMINW